MVGLVNMTDLLHPLRFIVHMTLAGRRISLLWGSLVQLVLSEILVSY